MPFYMKRPRTGKHMVAIAGGRKRVADGEVIECEPAALSGARDKFVEVPPPGQDSFPVAFEVVESPDAEGLYDVVRGGTTRKINVAPLTHDEAAAMVEALVDAGKPQAPTPKKGSKAKAAA